MCIIQLSLNLLRKKYLNNIMLLLTISTKVHTFIVIQYVLLLIYIT